MIDPSAVYNVVSEIFHVSLSDLRSHRRFARITRARHAVAYLLVRLANYGPTEAGELMGRDHSTISTSVGKAEQLIASDPTYATQLLACRAVLTAVQAAAVPPIASRRRDAWTIETSVHVALFWWGFPEPLTA